MALTNCYATLAEIKAALAIEDTNDDTALEAAITAASRMIDDYTGRFFYKDGTAQAYVSRYFTTTDFYNCQIDDIVTIKIQVQAMLPIYNANALMKGVYSTAKGLMNIS